MRTFLVAAQFLTRIPIRLSNVTERDLTRSVAFFPFVGLGLGLLGTGTYLAALQVFPTTVARVVCLCILIFAYSAFHLDGLSDSADAFYAGRDRESILRIMSDPHTGAMGVIAIAVVLLLKATCAMAVDERSFLTGLPAVTLLGHAAMTVSLGLLPCAGDKTSTARAFTRGGPWRTIPIALILTLPPVLFLLRLAGAAMVLAASAAAAWVAVNARRRMGGINGDVCGCISESVETAAWLALVAGTGIPDEWLRVSVGATEELWRWPL